jgi:hypothetical protein
VTYNRVSPGGLEPPASSLSGKRSDRLSYGDRCVDPAGFEPATSRVRGGCSTRMSYEPGYVSVAPARTDAVERQPGLEPGTFAMAGRRSPTELQPQVLATKRVLLRNREPSTGFEPVTSVVPGPRSDHLSYDGVQSPVRGSNPVYRSESPAVYLPQPHGRLCDVPSAGVEPATSRASTARSTIRARKA